MVVGSPNFWKLDSNDRWVGSCGSTECSQNHSIRRNTAILPSTCMDMNWLDFLDALDCFQLQRVAACQFCKKCSDCRRFKLLCAEAETITLNSWRQRCKSFVVAVRSNSLNQKYPKMLPMTVDTLNRVIINDDEEKLYKEKKQKNFYEKIINKYKKW